MYTVEIHICSGTIIFDTVLYNTNLHFNEIVVGFLSVTNPTKSVGPFDEQMEPSLQ
jgi:hypothetical protein